MDFKISNDINFPIYDPIVSAKITQYGQRLIKIVDYRLKTSGYSTESMLTQEK